MTENNCSDEMFGTLIKITLFASIPITKVISKVVGCLTQKKHYFQTLCMFISSDIRKLEFLNLHVTFFAFHVLQESANNLNISYLLQALGYDYSNVKERCCHLLTLIKGGHMS